MQWKKVLGLLGPGGRAQLAGLLALSLLAACLDLLGVGSVMPFMTLLCSPTGMPSSMGPGFLHRFGLTGTALMFLLALTVLLALLGVHLVQVALLRVACRFANEQQRLFSRRLYYGYLTRPYEWILAHSSLKLNESLGRARSLNETVYRPLVQLCCQGLASLMLVGLLAWIDGFITLIICASLGSLFLLQYVRCRDQVEQLIAAEVTASEQLKVGVADVLYALRPLRLAGVHTRLVKHHEEEVMRIATLQSRRMVLSEIPRLSIHSISQAGLLLLALYLKVSSDQSELLVPTLSLFALASYRLVPCLQAAMGALLTLRAGLPQMELLWQELEGVPQEVPMTPPALPIRIGFSLALKDVFYAYPDSTIKALSGCSLEIRPGERVALVGKTGSGKSTLLHVLLGLLEANRGDLLIDGRPLERSDLAGVQRAIGYVPQENLLADLNLENSIQFLADELQLDRQRLEKVAELTGIDAFVPWLSQGYATPLGERGCCLSGGQRQRVGLARALYRDPQLLILDEATNAMDARSEAQLMQRLAHRGGDCMLLVVAHRISSIRDFDRIYVLDQGQIVGQGRYSDLCQNNGYFQELLNEERPD